MSESNDELAGDRSSWLPRWYWWVLIGVVLLIGCGWGIYFYLGEYPGRNIHEANFEKIMQGMTKEEVIELLGPPGNYQTRRWRYAIGTNKECKYCMTCDSVEDWHSNGGLIAIGLDKNDRVVQKFYFNSWDRTLRVAWPEIIHRRPENERPSIFSW